MLYCSLRGDLMCFPHDRRKLQQIQLRDWIWRAQGSQFGMGHESLRQIAPIKERATHCKPTDRTGKDGGSRRRCEN